MSDILIKNTEMPKNCEDCFACQECSYESFDYCNILKAMTTRGERRNDCPLVALPEHGIISVHKVLDYLAERAEISKEIGDEETASLFASMGGDILAMSVEATE